MLSGHKPVKNTWCTRVLASRSGNTAALHASVMRVNRAEILSIVVTASSAQLLRGQSATRRLSGLSMTKRDSEAVSRLRAATAAVRMVGSGEWWRPRRQVRRRAGRGP